jgi:hypothetical protein
MPNPATAGLTVALVSAALCAAHGIGDMWVQRPHHALTKGGASWHGQLACGIHVATYTLTTTVAVMLVWALPLGTHITWTGFAAGQVFSAVTHYAIDRRWTLLTLANLLGKREFHDLGAPRDLKVVALKRVPVTSPAGTSHDEVTEVVVPLDNPVHATGATSLDQTLHHAALFIAALLTALI